MIRCVSPDIECACLVVCVLLPLLIDHALILGGMTDRQIFGFECLTAHGNRIDGVGVGFAGIARFVDETGDAAAVGKAVGKDAAAGKATFVSLLGLGEAKSRASALVDEACDALSCYGQAADRLQELARFVISRDK